MARPVRVALWLVAATQAAFAAGFFFAVPLVLALWPFPETGPMSQAFIASIFLAAAASTAWCLLAEEPAGLTGIGFDYLAIFAPLSVYALAVGLAGGSTPIAIFGVVALAGIAMGAGLVRLGRAQPFRDARPTPAIVRIAFMVFVVALVIVGGTLVGGGLLGDAPVIVPWPVTGQLSVVIGVMFLGAAVYFAYALMVPVRGNAFGQLAGFLAYDLVLIGPFLVRLPDIDPRFQLSLVVYTTVVTASGVLAIWQLGTWAAGRGRLDAATA